MKLYFEIIKLLFNKYIRHLKNGIVIKKFAEKMGVVYIKLAQILATQNFGELFTEEDRLLLSSLCDNCNIIEFSKIKNIIEKEYGKSINEVFEMIDDKSIGAASISQVHKAVLKNGDIVAVKVKRNDITNGIEKEIKRIKKLMFRFGKLVKFSNFIGGEKGLNLYLSWIYQETDFSREIQNIKTYKEFLDSVNGKVEGIKEIKVPKLYEDLCTDNIIVMEYIESTTINKMDLTNENNKKISDGINSYLKASFFALFYNKKIVFHGDPHSGNIYIDDNGNIGFLDMGLIFELSEEDLNLIKKFFFSAYTGNYEKLYNLLIPYGEMNEKKRGLFKDDIKCFCESIKEKSVTAYFTDMINICLNYDFSPPTFLFCMAKAFVCLNGINEFSNNIKSAENLLKTQIIEYFVKREMSDFQKILIDSVKITPEFFVNTCKYGLVESISKSIVTLDNISDNLKNSLEHIKEALKVMQPVN